jgi:hypothetical protein
MTAKRNLYIAGHIDELAQVFSENKIIGPGKMHFAGNTFGKKTTANGLCNMCSLFECTADVKQGAKIVSGCYIGICSDPPE